MQEIKDAFHTLNQYFLSGNRSNYVLYWLLNVVVFAISSKYDNLQGIFCCMSLPLLKIFFLENECDLTRGPLKVGPGTQTSNVVQLRSIDPTFELHCRYFCPM